MSAVAPLTRQPQPTLQVYLDDLRVRYGRLAARAASREDAATVARLGAKLGELLALAAQAQIEARDAALLPLLARWVARRLGELEGTPVAAPLMLPVPPPPDPRRAQALERAAAVYRTHFGVPPTPGALRRMDVLLAQYPLAALTDALAACARREGRIRWQAVEDALLQSGRDEGVEHAGEIRLIHSADG